MSPDAPAPEPQETPPARAPVPFQRLLRIIIPHVLTAIIAVAISLGLQAAFFGARVAQNPTPTAIATATARPTATPAPTAVPVPTVPLSASELTRLEILDLRAENDKIWSAIYLARAINQIAEAETALHANDLERVDQMIVATDDSLVLAYARTTDTLRDPIAQLRRDAGTLREDLYLRPEGIDTRLARLRQTLLTLIAERR